MKTNNNFDINNLSGLTVEELNSILKSNVISWDIRKEIRIKRNGIELNTMLREALPAIASVGIGLFVANEVGRLIAKELEKEKDDKERSCK